VFSQNSGKAGNSSQLLYYRIVAEAIWQQPVKIKPLFPFRRGADGTNTDKNRCIRPDGLRLWWGILGKTLTKGEKISARSPALNVK
jgi:hypothetical protein